MRLKKMICFCLMMLTICSIMKVSDEASAGAPGPEITNICLAPKYPIAGDNVTIYATITDLDGVEGALIIYCDELYPYAPVAMTNEGNDIWAGNISWNPSWEAGTVIGFEISSKDFTQNSTITEKMYFFFVSAINLATESQDTAYVGDMVILNGTALYNDNETAPVETSNVTVKIVETSQEFYSTTGNEGNCSVELVFNTVGTYTINTSVTNRTMIGYDEVTITILPVTITYFSEHVQLTTCYPDQQIWVNGTARYNSGKPVVNSDVEVVVDGTPFSTTKTDSNGTYSVLITVPSELGPCIVNVSITNGSLMAYNETTINITEEPKPDLTITSEDISFLSSRVVPIKEDEVNITVNVHNLGSADAVNVVVNFYLDEPSAGVLLGSDTVTLITAGDEELVSLSWTSTNGTHDIFVLVDPSDAIEETFENNNNASAQIFVDNDFDGDGIGDQADWDDDGDGYLDGVDAFPYDPDEWIDTDNDTIGDNADTDDDDDGLSDISEDKNQNGVVEPTETDPKNWDTDGDGVNDKDDYDPLDPNVTTKPSSKSSDSIFLIGILIVIVLIILVILVVFMGFRKKKGK